MGEIIELAVEGGVKLIDNIHRLPNSAFTKGTYHPRNLKKIRRRNRRRGSAVVADPSSDSDESILDPAFDDPRYPPIDSRPETLARSDLPPPRDAPRSRPQYIETRVRDLQVSDEPTLYRAYEGDLRGRPAVYYVKESAARPRRPVMVTRRSSSYHGPRDRYPRYEVVENRQSVRRPREEYITRAVSQEAEVDSRQLVLRPQAVEDNQLVVQSRVEGSQLQQRSRGDKSPDGSQRQVATQRRRRRDSAPDTSQQNPQETGDTRPEIDDFFSKSTIGVLGGAIGAATGAWIAHQAQIASGVEKKGSASRTAMTLLGAAVGGIAANVFVDKWEDGMKETAGKEKKWDDKWGKDGGGDGGGGGVGGEGRPKPDRRDRDRDRNGNGNGRY